MEIYQTYGMQQKQEVYNNKKPTYTKKKDLNYNLKKQEKEQMKLKVSRRKEINQLEINEIGTKKKIENVNETVSQCFEKIKMTICQLDS